MMFVLLVADLPAIGFDEPVLRSRALNWGRKCWD